MTSRFRLLPVVDPSLTGDRLNLPQSVLDALMNAQAGGGRGSSSPFVFEIRNAAGPLPTRTHGVVREFTAQEGTVCISPFLEEQLQTSAKAADRDANGDADGNANGDAAAADQEQQPVTVTLVELEKCTFARLAPLTPAYLSISDIRSVLESHLRRNHSTLTQGEVLQVTEPSRPDRSHPFVIVELQPAQACLCIDADVAVDVQPLDDAVAEAAVRAKYGIPDHGHVADRGLESAARGGQAVDVRWSAASPTVSMKGSCSMDLAAYVRVPRIPERPVVKLTVDPTEGDVDCFVSLTAEKPTLLDHDWFSVETGKKEVLVDLSTAADVEDPFIYVALVADSPRASFALQFEAVAPSTVEAAAPSESREKQARLVDSAGAEPKPDEAACPNCGASVPLRTLQMHLAFCERNNRKCTKCERVFKKEDLASHWHCDLCDKVGHISEQSKHTSRFHTALVCECGLSLHLPQVAFHRRNECPDRFIVCRFCHLRVRAGQLSRTAKDLYLGTKLGEHESECGARTITCQKCSRAVQLKDVQSHAKFHEFEKATQPIFRLCSNRNCATPENDQFRNPLRACMTCFAPFWISRHDPGHQKLAEKLIGAYHKQLTVGCCRPVCFNQYCVVSQHEAAPKAPMDPTSAAVLAFQLLQKSALQRPDDPEHYLCIADAASSRRRHVAETVLAPLGFRVAWCVRALQETRDDADRAASWLVSNAPKQ